MDDQRSIRRVCVFCGSNPGTRPLYREAAADLGRLLAERGLGLVYGGGSVGLMGALADAALAAGGEVIGVIPERLKAKEGVHRGVTRMHVVPTMHARKSLMADLSDAFAVLPGGFGTLEEAFEAINWAQLGLHRKPIGLLNEAGYFDPLLAFLDEAMAEGFIRREHRRLFVVSERAEALLDSIFRPVPSAVPR